jgi:hypothetical protein
LADLYHLLLALALVGWVDVCPWKDLLG